MRAGKKREGERERGVEREREREEREKERGRERERKTEIKGWMEYTHIKGALMTENAIRVTLAFVSASSHLLFVEGFSRHW